MENTTEVARKRLKTSSLLLFNNQRSMDPAKLSLPIFYIKKAEQVNIPLEKRFVKSMV